MFSADVPRTYWRLYSPVSPGSGLPQTQMQVCRDNAGVDWIAKAEAGGRGTEIRNQGALLLLLGISEGNNIKLKLSRFGQITCQLLQHSFQKPTLLYVINTSTMTPRRLWTQSLPYKVPPPAWATLSHLSKPHSLVSLPLGSSLFTCAGR